MKIPFLSPLLVICWITSFAATCSQAQDWPQWLGPDRNAKAASFSAPASWPKQLKQQWKSTVGDGVATPALVGNKLFVFARQEGNEIIRCLDAASGKELWQNAYPSLGATGPASSFSGPRSSPAVADGKVVTLGVRGMLSCWDAASGKKLWSKDDIQGYPRFHPSSSPILMDGLCIAQLGGQDNGALVAYDLATGAEKWKWSGSSPTYASPSLLILGGTKLIVAQTESKLVAIRVADGTAAWEETPAPSEGGSGRGGGGRDYKAATPMVSGNLIVTAGRGTKAFTLNAEGDGIAAKPMWNNAETSVQFNTPILKNGLVYGLSPANAVFCVDAGTGRTAWTSPLTVAAEPAPDPAGRGGRGGRGGGGGGRGYGSIVDGGSVLVALTPASELVVFEPSDKAFTELARIKVAESPTHAYPVLSGSRVFIKDQDSVTLWTLN
jgi:outer membrane protein assembly factor BamB